jgi:hypothetical protein
MSQEKNTGQQSDLSGYNNSWYYPGRGMIVRASLVFHKCCLF